MTKRFLRNQRVLLLMTRTLLVSLVAVSLASWSLGTVGTPARATDSTRTSVSIHPHIATLFDTACPKSGGVLCSAVGQNIHNSGQALITSDDTNWLSPSKFPTGTGIQSSACPNSNGTLCASVRETSSGNHMVMTTVDDTNRTTASSPQALWGVDSYDQITHYAPGYATLYDSVTANFGTPDFWARYIGNDPEFPNDMDLTEAPFAHAHGLAILPIYFNYDETQVQGYDTGQYYALLAIEDAEQRLQISQGVGIFVDIEGLSFIEPDAAFIQGWYDEFNSTFTYTINGQDYTYQAGYYNAGYYANTSVAGNFDAPFCAAVSNEPAIGTNSFIWTNQISQNITDQTFDAFSKAFAPAYNPLALSCADQQIPIPATWQYGLEGGSSSMVDVDRALPYLPLWYP